MNCHLCTVTSECKRSYTYIDFTLLFALIRRLKKDFFRCLTLVDIFECDDVGTWLLYQIYYMDAREIPSFQSEIKTGKSLNEIKCFSYHDVTHSTQLSIQNTIVGPKAVSFRHAGFTIYIKCLKILI
jgi:hypothetical protein